MSKYHTIRIVLIALSLVAISVASVYLYQAKLFFCLVFSVVIVLVLIACLCSLQKNNFLLIERLVDSLRYKDFSLNFSLKGKNATER